MPRYYGHSFELPSDMKSENQPNRHGMCKATRSWEVLLI